MIRRRMCLFCIACDHEHYTVSTLIVRLPAVDIFMYTAATHAVHRYPHIASQPVPQSPFIPKFTVMFDTFNDDWSDRNLSIGHTTVRVVNLITALRERLSNVHTLSATPAGEIVTLHMFVDVMI